MEEIVIRDATPEDFDAWLPVFREIHRLHTEAQPQFFSEPAASQLREDFAAMLADASGRLVMAETAGELAGYAWVSLRDSPDHPIFQPRRFAFVNQISVLERYRGRGIGKALMRAAKRYAEEQGATELELGVWEFNRAAIAFYESLGFETRERRMSARLDAADC